MGYDRGDSLPFDFEPNGNPFGSISKGKLSPRSYPIQCERKWNTSFLSEAEMHVRLIQKQGWKKHHREIGVCQHHGGPVEDPLKPFGSL